jgi:hypothetical protein
MLIVAKGGRGVKDELRISDRIQMKIQVIMVVQISKSAVGAMKI